MSETIMLKAEKREILGTGNARELRRQGFIPATIYGNGQPEISVSLEEKEMTKLYRRPGFKTTVFELDVNGKKHKVLAKDVQLHPVTELVRHVDFMHLAKKEQKVAVPIKYVGKERSLGIKRGGFFNTIMRNIPLICPVDSIPQNVEIDISNLRVGAVIKSTEVALPANCKPAFKGTKILASITGRGSKDDAEEKPGAPEKK